MTTNAYIKNYPRPQFVRKEWLDLNGEWDFAFDDGKMGESEQCEKDNSTFSGCRL